MAQVHRAVGVATPRPIQIPLRLPHRECIAPPRTNPRPKCGLKPTNYKYRCRVHLLSKCRVETAPGPRRAPALRECEDGRGFSGDIRVYRPEGGAEDRVGGGGGSARIWCC
jgi:hypothetical protein